MNTTLNLVRSGDKLAWQQRKSESFSMTPFFCGNHRQGYRPSADYGGHSGISLSTAMAISGAAANPNMGYNSSPSVGFLMTLFNARLGAWLGNTNRYGQMTYRRNGPHQALVAAVRRAVRHDARGRQLHQPFRRRPLRQPRSVRGGAAALPEHSGQRRGLRRQGARSRTSATRSARSASTSASRSTSRGRSRSAATTSTSPASTARSRPSTTRRRTARKSRTAR